MSSKLSNVTELKVMLNSFYLVEGIVIRTDLSVLAKGELR